MRDLQGKINIRLATFAVLVSLLFPITAGAEWFIDGYIGPAYTRPSKLSGIPGSSVPIHPDNPTFSGGGRAGYFFESWPYFGLGIDVSHFTSRGDAGGVAVGFGVVHEVTSVSFDAILRLPLLSSQEFPTGRLQPYMMLGPGAYFSHLDIDPSAPLRKNDINAGVKVGVGSAWMFNRNLGIFGEYRFSHFSPSYGITIAPLSLRNIVNTHQLQFGVSLRI